MAMLEATRIAYENEKKRLGTKVFNKDELIGVSPSTLMKYNLVESTEKIIKTEMSIKDACERLNNLEGEDNWYDSSSYYKDYAVENGKLYQLEHYRDYYRFK